jgi:crotonobetainyl-CoA:carnitine CoA-transferase CaiB-like acyl-CoA transferase
LNAIQKKHWDTFCEVVDRQNWKDRMEDSALVPEMEKLFLDAPSTYWEALSSNRDLCLFRVIPWEEHISFSQARPMLATDPLTWAGFPPNPSLLPCPSLGRDTYAIMHSLGATNKEISDHLQQGIIFQPDKKT